MKRLGLYDKLPRRHWLERHLAKIAKEWIHQEYPNSTCSVQYKPPPDTAFFEGSQRLVLSELVPRFYIEAFNQMLCNHAKYDWEHEWTDYSLIIKH